MAKLSSTIAGARIVGERFIHSQRQQNPEGRMPLMDHLRELRNRIVKAVLALAAGKDGSGALEPLTNFMTNPAGAAIVNALGPIRQIVQGEVELPRRYLVIVQGSAAEPGKPVQVQAPDTRVRKCRLWSTADIAPRKIVEIANDVKRELGISGEFLRIRDRSIGDHGI